MDLVKPGKMLSLRGAKVDMFRGSLRLIVPNTGSIELAGSAKLEPKVDSGVTLHCNCKLSGILRAALFGQTIWAHLANKVALLAVQVDNNVSLVENELVPIMSN